MMRQYSLKLSFFVVAVDVLLVVLALLASTYARIHLPFGLEGHRDVWILPLPVYGIAVLLWYLIFAFFNVYDPYVSASFLDELREVTKATAFAWLLLIGVLYLSYREISRLQIIYFLLFFLLFVLLFRLGLRLYAALSRRALHTRRVLIIGTGEIAQEIGTQITRGWTGLSLAGYVREPGAAGEPGLPLLGELPQVLGLVGPQQITDVVIALPWQIQEQVSQLVRQLQALPLNIFIVPDYFDMSFLRLQVRDLGNIPLVSLKEPALTPLQRLNKRLFDVLMTLLLLLPAIPLMLLVALAVKLDSPGPIFFLQERVGENRRLFRMFKFRSMKVNAPSLPTRVDEAGNPIYKYRDEADPRITRVGRFIRRTSLDELPQLFNILRGDMSLVGPRPEMPWLVEKYEAWQHKRFEVPQGLTGWWQVTGRADKPMHLSTDDDLFYIRNYSLWLDIQIMWRTIEVILTRRGAF